MAETFVGNYKVIRKIAETSVGEVFEAIDLIRNKRAALHCVRAEGIGRPEILEALHLQVETLARLNHPNIARVFGSIRKGESLNLVMELVEGETLDVILRRKGRIQLAAALAFFQQTLSAVGFAHGLGVIHGNLAPSSIVVTNFGLVKVMDFAIAHVQGTPGAAGLGIRAVQYLSPEQLRGEPLDARSDIYSLGILLYELIVGHVRFDSASEGQTTKAQSAAISLPRSLFAADSPEWLAAWLETVLRRALAESPSNRFQSVTEMAHAMGFEVKTHDRTMWKEQPAVRLPRIGRWVSSVSNPFLMTVNVAFRSLRTTLDAASEIGRQRSASIGHVIRLIVATNHPTVSAQRAIAGLQDTRRWVSSVFNSLWIRTNRMFGSLKVILTALAETSRQRSASIARATRLGVEARNPSDWTQRVVVGLQHSGFWVRSGLESVLIGGNRVFQSLRATFFSPAINRKRNALLASLAIAVAIGGFFFRGQNDPALNEAVDKMMAQANSRPIEVKPAQRGTEQQKKVVKALNKRPHAPDKPVSTRSIAKKEPEPIQRRVVERPGRPVSAAINSDKETTTAKAPPPQEPFLSEKKAEHSVATTKLNVRWEN